MADFTVEPGTIQRVADVGGNSVLRLDTDTHAGYNDVQFTEAGSGTDFHIDSSGNLYLAGKKHTRNGVTASVNVMPASREMRLGYNQVNPQASLLVGIGGGQAAYHDNS